MFRLYPPNLTYRESTLKEHVLQEIKIKQHQEMHRTEIYATGEVQLQFCSQVIFFLSVCIFLRALA
jgi:hypothetical protein